MISPVEIKMEQLPMAFASRGALLAQLKGDTPALASAAAVDAQPKGTTPEAHLQCI